MIQFINQDFLLDPNSPLRFNAAVGAATCGMIIPLVDTTRIIIIRLYKKISPFTPDKRHIHHSLIRLGLSHRQTVYILTIVHISMIGIAVLLRKAGDWLVLGTVVFATVLLSLILERLLSKARKKEISIEHLKQG